MGGAALGNGSWVGLDVHAQRTVAGVIQHDTGELRVVRAPHRTEELVRWLGELDSQVRVAYEAGPTGFGLARALAPHGIGGRSPEGWCGDGGRRVHLIVPDARSSVTLS